MKVNLEKAKKVVLNLIKETPVENVKARVVVAVDYSGSMSPLYSNGTVQTVLERILPIAMTFDDNSSLEVYKFDHRSIPIDTEITPSNYEGFVNKYIHNGDMGGTEYTPVMEDIVKRVPAAKSGGAYGFIKSLFTKKVVEDKPVIPTYVIFLTDSDCSDKEETIRYIRQTSDQPVFWQFVGIGSSQFRTLELLDTMQGRVIDNANFFAIRDTRDLVNMTDEVLLGKLLAEFPSWYKEAKEKNIVK